MRKTYLMKMVYLFLIFLITIFSFTSCYEFVTDKFPECKSSPTVNCILKSGAPLSVYLSIAGKLDSLPLPWIENARVDLWVDGVFAEDLTNKGEGLYLSKTVVEPLKNYTCKVIIPGSDTIVCNQTIPEPVPVLKVEHINVAGLDEEGNTYPAVKITFPNNIHERRYFMVFIKCFFYFQNDTDEYRGYVHTFIDPVILNEGLPLPLFSNEIINDSIYTLTLNYNSNYSNHGLGVGVMYRNYNPFVIELYSLTYDFYRYLQQRYLSDSWSYGLLATKTPCPFYSNIINGYGIFAGYSVFTSDTITPAPYEDK
jgi:hypothetical protein